MTLPVSGAISFNNINVELGVAGTTQASLGQSSYRTLAGVASGAISMSNFYGKSNRAAISYTFSSNTADAALNLSSISGYAAGTSDITVTINSGIYLYATSTGGYGLNISGATTGDTLTIVNNGYIIGKGGSGTTGNAPSGSGGAENGGPALNLNFGMSSCTINNTNSSAYIAGGGGGGGGAKGGSYKSQFLGGGGGAGGGNGSYSTKTNGGAGGGPGSSGSNGIPYGGGGGGRILPGVNSPVVAGDQNGRGGQGGGGGGAINLDMTYGGGSTNAGQNGTDNGESQQAGGGGGWSASGGRNNEWAPWYYPGSGGKAVNLNGKSVTWTSGNTTRVWGAVS